MAKHRKNGTAAPERPLAAPEFEVLVDTIKHYTAEDVTGAIIQSFNTAGINTILWRLCEVSGIPAASNLTTHEDQFVLTRKSE